MVTLDRKDLAKYPFLKESQAFISTHTESLDSFLDSGVGRLAVSEALTLIKRSLHEKPGSAAPAPDIPSDADGVAIIISTYAVSRILISCFGDRSLIDRLTRFQARMIYSYLQEEDPSKKEYISTTVGLPGISKTIPVRQYIEIVCRLPEDRWRLVNRQVARGLVYVKEDETDEILRERLRFLMASNLPLKVPGQICERLKPILDRIGTMYQERMLEEFGTVEESAFPPCMQALVNALTDRSHLTHMARFAVTSFLHNIGMDNTRIVEIYGRSPDFDLQRTMYQVDHISGQGGNKTEYTSPLCATMRTHSLCVHPDSFCQKVSHPLSYYKIKKKQKVFKKNERETGESENPSGTHVPDKKTTDTDSDHKEKQSDHVRSLSVQKSGQEQNQNIKNNKTDDSHKSV